MAEPKSYSGACHCGAVAFEAPLDLSGAIECNCSICESKGLRLAFTPAADFVLKRGEDELSEYRFNTMKISHHFCRACGVETFGRASAPDGTPMVAVNVRCLEGVDQSALATRPFDGRSR